MYLIFTQTFTPKANHSFISKSYLLEVTELAVTSASPKPDYYEKLYEIES